MASRVGRANLVVPTADARLVDVDACGPAGGAAVSLPLQQLERPVLEERFIVLRGRFLKSGGLELGQEVRRSERNGGSEDESRESVPHCRCLLIQVPGAGEEGASRRRNAV